MILVNKSIAFCVNEITKGVVLAFLNAVNEFLKIYFFKK